MADSALFAVGLGSNIGDRFRFLDTALDRLDSLPNFAVQATSTIYESAGWGLEGMDPFLNAVLVGRGSIAPQELLAALQRIEDDLGRQRTIRWGPRTLDLDMLACEDRQSTSPNLELPHPWIGRRPFVYIPFAELADLHPAWPPLVQPQEEGLRIEKDTVRTRLGRPFWGVRVPHATELEFLTTREEETTQLAGSLAPALLPGDVVALEAAMGAGKSVFARAVLRALGVTGPIPSPTFTLCRRYEVRGRVLEHWDFYRLGSLDDLESTGFFSPESRGAIRLVEWPSLFPDAVPQARWRVALEATGDDTRRIHVACRDGAVPFRLRAQVAARGGAS